MLFSKWLEITKTSQAEAARMLDVSESTVSLIISRHRTPSPKLAQLIVEKTDGKVSLEEALFPEQYGKTA